MLNDPMQANIDYQSKVESEEYDLAKQVTQSDTGDKKSIDNEEYILEERIFNIVENEGELDEDLFDEKNLKKLKKTKLIEKEKKINKLLSLNYLSNMRLNYTQIMNIMIMLLKRKRIMMIMTSMKKMTKNLKIS
jgi:hypothetical protein